MVVFAVVLVASAASFARPLVGYAASEAASGGTYYTVRRGDTLSAIAKRFGVTVSAITRANNIRNPSRIVAGTRLFIPGVKPLSTPRPVKPLLQPTPAPTVATTESLIPTTRPP